MMLITTLCMSYIVNLNAEGTEHQEDTVQVPRTHITRRHAQARRRECRQESILPQLYTLGPFGIIAAEETGGKAGEKNGK